MGEACSRIPSSARRISPDTIYIVCNQGYRFYVGASLQENGEQGRILLEPAPRNTAPAIALAAFSAREQGDPLLLVLPSDHILKDNSAFTNSVYEACTVAEQGRIITFGITPTGPETRFGYIRQGAAIAPGILSVERFVEKPDAPSAEAMLKEGGYSWNSGMFLFKASVYLHELQRYAPEREIYIRPASRHGKSISLSRTSFARKRKRLRDRLWTPLTTQ